MTIFPVRSGFCLSAAPVLLHPQSWRTQAWKPSPQHATAAHTYPPEEHSVELTHVVAVAQLTCWG
jgi:hypothetical protein